MKAVIGHALETGIITYKGMFKPAPGIKMEVICLVRFIDQDHFSTGWHPTIDGHNAGRSEINYPRHNTKNQ